MGKAFAQHVTVALVILGSSFATDRLAAQWLNHPTPVCRGRPMAK